MSHVSMNIHCTGVTAKSNGRNGVEWLTLIFECGGAGPEISLFFETSGHATILAKHIAAAFKEMAEPEKATAS